METEWLSDCDGAERVTPRKLVWGSVLVAIGSRPPWVNRDCIFVICGRDADRVRTGVETGELNASRQKGFFFF